MTDNLTQRLLQGLSLIPSSWSIVPTNGNKQPLGYKWQQNPFHRDELIGQLQLTGGVKVRNQAGNQVRVYPQGIGVLTGRGMVALDVDGSSAMKVLHTITKGNMPQTVAFTSGKPGRCQYLFSIPDGTEIRSRRIKAPMSGEALEIRGAGMMSVLPPSVHPQTGRYRWVVSPVECTVGTAPKWLNQLIPKSEKSAPQSLTVKNQRIAALLAQLAPWRADDYNEWIRIGMALYSYSPSLLAEWDWWSQQSSKYQPGECTRKWATFHPTRISIGTLFYLARIDSGI